MASTLCDKDKVRTGIQSFLGDHLGLLQRHHGFSGYERDCLYRNRGDGTFEDRSGVSGIDSIGDGRAAVFWDYDNDGDLDLFVRAMHGPAHALYRNDIGNRWRSLRVTLRGKRSGRDAFGATVRVHTNRGTLSKIKSGGAGFLSQHDPRLTFGLGTRKVRAIEVFWPSGHRQRITIKPDTKTVTITEDD